MFKNRLIFLFFAIYLWSCTSIKDKLRNWLEVDSEMENSIIPDVYELNDDIRNLHKKHDGLLQYLRKKQFPAKGWELYQLQFIPDSTGPGDTITYFLCASLISDSRYNPKFMSVHQQQKEEWKKFGRDFLTSWSKGFQELQDAGVGIQLDVEYKTKNFMRPHERLRKTKLTYRISFQTLKNSDGEVPRLYDMAQKSFFSKEKLSN